MKSITTRAVILRTRDYGESDRLVSFFCEAQGRLTGLAKSARRSRRRFVNCLEPCSLVQITFRVKKSLVWIEACKLLEPYSGLRTELDRWLLGILACEIFLEMAPEGQSEKNWLDLLEEALENLAGGREPLNAALLFAVRFLDGGGYLPALRECSLCRAPLRSSRHWKWQVRKGILACRKHVLNGDASLPLDLGSLMLLDLCRRLPLEKIWRHRFAPDKRLLLFRGLMDTICAHTGRDLKCFQMLKQLRMV